MTWFEAAEVWIKEAGPRVEEQLIKTITFDLRDTPNSTRGTTFKELSGLRLLTSMHLTAVEVTTLYMYIATTMFSNSGLSVDEKSVHLAFPHLQETRQKNLELLRDLIEPPSDLQVEQAALCHLTRGGQHFFTVKCDICVAEGALVEYGTKLFSDYYGSTR